MATKSSEKHDNSHDLDVHPSKPVSGEESETVPTYDMSSSAAQPFSPTKEDMEPSGNKESTQQSSQSGIRHRRLRPVEDSGSDSESDSGQIIETMVSKSYPVQEIETMVSKSYLQDVLVTEGFDQDEEIDEQAHSPDANSDDSEAESVKESKEKVNIEDFDDEEEFLLAGGEIEDAKKRKEWGLHESDKEEEDNELNETLISAKDVSVSKENLRKLQRESERLLRERRCIIPPAPVQRRSFGDLVQRISSRASIIDKIKFQLVGSDQDGSILTPLGPLESRKFSNTETLLPPPSAPKDDSGQNDADPVGLNEDDDEEELLVIIKSNSDDQNSSDSRKDCTLFCETKDQITLSSCEIEKENSSKPCNPDSNLKRTEGVISILKSDLNPSSTKSGLISHSRDSTHSSRKILSPPANNPKRVRMALRDALMKTAQLRSEHLSKILLSKPGPAPGVSEQSSNVETFVQNAISLPFVPAASFLGSKTGYVFKMGGKGLGYYADGLSRKISDSPSVVSDSNMLPPPIEDLPEQEIAAASSEEESEPAFELEGERLVLEYEGDETLMPEDEDGAAELRDHFEGLESYHSEKQHLKRTYAKKKRVNDSSRQINDQPDLSKEYPGDLPDDEISDPESSDKNARQRKRDAKVIDDSDEGSENDEVNEGDDEGGESNDDDDSSEEDESSSGEDDSDEDKSEEESKEAPAPVKKTLADITSIKRQSTLRLGTMEAGYLRTEQEALGIHEDIGVAEEDLGEGIDLENTDGEDESEEEADNSEEERKVAEGFLEDAKFAGEVNPDVLRRAHMEITEADEQRMTEKILDVVRGDVRRRKAAKEMDDWIPNRSARVRLQTGADGLDGGANLQIGDEAFDHLEEQEAEEAKIAAALAKERLERMRFMQKKKELDAMQEKSSDEEAEVSKPAMRPAPMVRKPSCAVPSLAEFGRQISGAGLVRSISGSREPGQQSNAFGVPLKRGSSLLGSGMAQPVDPQAHQPQGTIASGKVFFFDTKQRGPDTATEPEPVASAHHETTMSRKRSDGGWSLTVPAKAQKTTNNTMQRSTSLLRQNLDML